MVCWGAVLLVPGFKRNGLLARANTLMELKDIIWFFQGFLPVMLVMMLVVIARAGYGRESMRGRSRHKVCRRGRRRVDVRSWSWSRVASMWRQWVTLVFARSPALIGSVAR